jgi:hypothetical protein
MPRILITGMNRNQCTRDYYRTQELQVVASHYSLIRCLEDMGWTVEQREVELGEDLSSYDEVVIYVHNLQGYAHCLYSGLYAVSARPDAILAFDDWQVREMMLSLSNFIRYVEEDRDYRVLKDYIIDIQMTKRSKEQLRPFVPDYVRGCEVVLRRNNRLLLSAFAGGDLTKMNLGWDMSRVYAFNPNPYHLNRQPSNSFGSDNPLMSLAYRDYRPEEKVREWNFASLLHNKTKTWLKRQGCSWPVNMFGQRKGETRTARITEDDMCQIYNIQWGCLMPGYPHAGSGWWRARPLQVADAGSVLVCDDDEGRILGEPYVGVRARDVEQMDTGQLTALARLQKEALYDRHPLDREVTKRELSSILEATP